MNTRSTVTSFFDSDGVEHELREPDGPATAAQLRVLNDAGRLQLIDAGATYISRITKGEAAHAVAVEIAAGRVELVRRPSSAEIAQRTWEAIVKHVGEHPGCSGSDLYRAVRGKRILVRQRLDELLACGVIVDAGSPRRVELWLGDDVRRPGDDAEWPA